VQGECCHEFDFSLVSSMLSPMVVAKQMSMALLRVSASNLWQSAAQCQQQEPLFMSSGAASRKCPPRAAYREQICLRGLPGRGGRISKHTFHTAVTL